MGNDKSSFCKKPLGANHCVKCTNASHHTVSLLSGICLDLNTMLLLGAPEHISAVTPYVTPLITPD